MSLNVNGYKNTEDTQKQTNIYYGKMVVPPWNHVVPQYFDPLQIKG